MGPSKVGASQLRLKGSEMCVWAEQEGGQRHGSQPLTHSCLSPQSCQADLVKDSGHKYFLSVLADPYMPVSPHRGKHLPPAVPGPWQVLAGPGTSLRMSLGLAGSAHDPALAPVAAGGSRTYQDGREEGTVGH